MARSLGARIKAANSALLANEALNRYVVDILAIR